jgi:hypothetical protein
MPITLYNLASSILGCCGSNANVFFGFAFVCKIKTLYFRGAYILEGFRGLFV